MGGGGGAESASEIWELKPKKSENWENIWKLGSGGGGGAWK